MSELAFNINGEGFEMPATATGWRVRRMKLKGAPEVVYGRDGLPLVLPVDAELDDLKREVDVPGRYRLDPVDVNCKAIATAPSAYVHVNLESTTRTAPTPAHVPSDNVIIEAMRMNAELARTVIDRFPQMMDSAATLIRAADGAGLPARPGMVQLVDDDEEEVQTTPAPGGFDLGSIIAQLVPPLAMAFMSGKSKLPSLAEMLDWQKAVPKDKQPQPAATQEAKVESPVVPSAPKPDAATMMDRFRAIQAELSPHEQLLAVTMAKELSDADRQSWMEQLVGLSVPEAVAKVREILGTKAGGES